MMNISGWFCLEYFLRFLIYTRLIRHVVLVSCMALGNAQSSCASSASRPLQAPECPHGVPPHHGDGLT
jgi:hypothetical protein